MTRNIQSIAEQRIQDFKAYLDESLEVVKDRLQAICVLKGTKHTEISINYAVSELKPYELVSFQIYDSNTKGGASISFDQIFTDTKKIPAQHLLNLKVEYNQFRVITSFDDFLKIINKALDEHQIPPINEMDLPLNPNKQTILGSTAIFLAQKRAHALNKISDRIKDSVIAQFIELQMIFPHEIDQADLSISIVPSNQTKGQYDFTLSYKGKNSAGFGSVAIRSGINSSINHNSLEQSVTGTIEEIVKAMNKGLDEDYAINYSDLPEIPTSKGRSIA